MRQRFRWFLAAALLLLPAVVNAQSITLAWDPSSSPGVTGYRLRYGTASGSYTSSIDVGAQTTYTVSGLTPTVRYYFVVVAYSPTGTSGFSNEVSGLPGFTDSAITSGITTIRAVHILELRQHIDMLRAEHGLPAQTWTDTNLTGVAIRSIHITELRVALAAVYAALGRAAPIYTDSALVPGVTVVKAAHITELRTAVLAVE